MSLDATASTAAVGVAAVLVAVWGGWLSIGASRHGAGWARSHLRTWRYGPWMLAVGGAGLALAVTPVWVGIGVVYIAAVTGLLMRQLRRRLEVVEKAFGPFEQPVGAVAVSRRTGGYLLVGGSVLTLLAVADTAVRGWSGLFGLALAGTLVVVGWLMRRG